MGEAEGQLVRRVVPQHVEDELLLDRLARGVEQLLGVAADALEQVPGLGVKEPDQLREGLAAILGQRQRFVLFDDTLQQAAMDVLEIEPVLTAHPSEVQRKSILDAERATGSLERDMPVLRKEADRIRYSRRVREKRKQN